MRPIARYSDELRTRHVKEFVAFASVDIDRYHPRARRHWRRQRPQDVSIARIDSPHTVAVAGGGDFESAVARKIDERMFDRGGLARVAFGRCSRIGCAAQAMPEGRAVGIEQCE